MQRGKSLVLMMMMKMKEKDDDDDDEKMCLLAFSLNYYLPTVLPFRPSYTHVFQLSP